MGFLSGETFYCGTIFSRTIVEKLNHSFTFGYEYSKHLFKAVNSKQNVFKALVKNIQNTCLKLLILSRMCFPFLASY